MLLGQGTFMYGGIEHKLVPHPQGQSYEACNKLTALVLKQSEACGAPQVCRC